LFLQTGAKKSCSMPGHRYIPGMNPSVFQGQCGK
jgi:hypothetical protein